jgi:CBS domain-containing protein/ubiquinone/menaquinone biosynthesis C-methylase UbiE
MLVKDLMSTTVDYVNVNTKVKQVSRIIFGRGINGVPVCEGKKVIGFISERDILARFYPSMAEFADDPFREGNFEEMEEKIEDIFSMTANEIMSSGVTTVSPDTPVLRAQSMMFLHRVGRLPVVDENNNLIGIIAQGDIFRASVGDRLPFTAEEEYHDWQAKHYDIITDWSQRLKNEIPDLAKLFKKHKVTDVLDIGYGTGEHDIALARKGFNIVGIESSLLMYKSSEEKRKKLSKELRERLRFLGGNYNRVLPTVKSNFGAAIFMGNAFSHLVPHYQKVLDSVNSVLSEKAVVVLQVINFEKIYKVKNRIVDTTFGKAKSGITNEHLFLRFYDPPQDGFHTLNTAIFDHDGRRWKFRTMNSTSIVDLDKERITKIFKKHGFKKIEFYGGRFFGSLFKEKFDPIESDWLNVVAIR